MASLAAQPRETSSANINKTQALAELEKRHTQEIAAVTATDSNVRQEIFKAINARIAEERDAIENQN